LSGSYTGVTGVGTLTAGTWNASVIGAVYGGTGQSSYAVGDLVYANTTTTLAKLADVAVGNALISGGVGAAPSYGKIGLATHVSGTLPIANGGTGSTSTQFVALGTNVSGTLPVGNGGTGAATFTANNVLLGNGTSAFQVVAPGTNGNVLQSNGTTWVSASAPSTMVYPGAGIPNSTGTSWATSYSTSGTGTVVALATSPSLTTPTLTGPTVSGNLTFTGTGNRITGDFSNATLASRVTFQTSTVNGATVVSGIPNGSGSAAGFQAYTSSDPTNSSRLALTATTDIRIASDQTGTGTYLPMTFYTGGSERVRIDTSGNVGIGTSSPVAPLTVASSTTLAAGNPSIVLTGESNTERIQVRAAGGASAGTPVVLTAASRGTVAVPTAIQSGDTLGFYQFGGHNGTAFTRGAWISGNADGAYSATNSGSAIYFATTPNGSTTIAERMRITSAGGVSFGATGTAYGTSGQVLTSAGNAPPTWTTPASGGVTSITGTASQITASASTGAVTLSLPATINVNTSGSSASCTGNAATATALSSGQTNWSGTGVLGNVVGMLGWKNYGNSHVIFDASNGTSPSGTAVNNTNSQAVWTATYPTLMGWNGSNTYGVRVDVSRLSDSATTASACTGNVSGTNTVNKSFQASNAVIGNASGSLNTLEVLGSGNAAMMTFHRPGAFAAYFGLDSDNVWKVGGWSYGGVSYPLLYSGSTTAPGGAPVYASRVWVNFAGASGAIRASGNMSSVTRHGAGDYTLNFATAMPDANYAVSGMSNWDGTNRGSLLGINGLRGGPATGSVPITTLQSGAFTAIDNTWDTVAVFR
jgi:hypothetical protein